MNQDEKTFNEMNDRNNKKYTRRYILSDREQIGRIYKFKGGISHWCYKNVKIYKQRFKFRFTDETEYDEIYFIFNDVTIPEDIYHRLQAYFIEEGFGCIVYKVLGEYGQYLRFSIITSQFRDDIDSACDMLKDYLDTAGDRTIFIEVD